MDALVCVSDGFIYDDVDYGLRIQQRLTAEGLETGRVDLTKSNLDTLPPARVYVFTGGETSVNTETAWMRRAVEHAGRLVRTAGAATHSVVGICLGSQIIAEALRPGSITSLPAMDIGLIRVMGRDGAHGQETVPTFHYQAISPHIESIDGVRVTWSSPTTPVEGFSYGSAVYGFQFHPELTSDDMLELINGRADEIEFRNGTVADARHSVGRYRDSLSSDLFRRLVVDRCRVGNGMRRVG
ncbi:type 1 glutamine amidotransferase [Nocardia sp. NBC_00403]|uniref:type 1 glutamine amidotransferase n=1 Tax=Nocardia sp. NBC_00403 TaxID=2975990 RepID=UPI002E1D7B71